jgi:hypothetical protein
MTHSLPNVTSQMRLFVERSHGDNGSTVAALEIHVTMGRHYLKQVSKGARVEQFLAAHKIRARRALTDRSMLLRGPRYRNQEWQVAFSI